MVSSGLSFEWWWMLLLLPAPFLYRLIRSPQPQSSAALKIPVYQQLLAGQQGVIGTGSKNPLSLILLLTIWIAVLLAAAKPIWVGEPIEIPTTGRDLLLVVDISGSMETADMEISGDFTERILAVKVVLGQFIERRIGDRLGLILFGGAPYLQAPLTFDHSTLYQLLQEAQVGFAGNATAIGSAIGLGVKRLQQRPENHRVMILLTDGANTAGTLDPIQAAEAAAQYGVKVYTIGIGAESLIKRGLFGKRRINPSADLDEETLQAIADKTGGRYFRAQDVNQLNQIYLELDKLEPIEQQAETLRPTKALFYWPLSVALVSCLILLIWRGLRGESNG